MNKPVKIGILGGMGPMATSFLFDRVVRHTRAERDQDHVDLVIVNRATMPDRTQAIRNGQSKPIVEQAVADCRAMEGMGVEYIAIPCNTSHYFFDEIQQQVGAELIHMVRETVRFAMKDCPGLKKLGIMATDGTIMADVYGKECRALGIEPVYPSDERQKDVMHLIYEEVKKGERGEEDRFYRVVSELTAKGCERIVLACTELSYFRQYYTLPSYVIDSTDVLVRCIIEKAGKTYME